VVRRGNFHLGPLENLSINPQSSNHYIISCRKKQIRVSGRSEYQAQATRRPTPGEPRAPSRQKSSRISGAIGFEEIRIMEILHRREAVLVERSEIRGQVFFLRVDQRSG
jgi:hypothetical protein